MIIIRFLIKRLKDFDKQVMILSTMPPSLNGGEVTNPVKNLQQNQEF